MLGDILSFVGKGLDMWNSSNNTDKQIAAQKQLNAENIANQKEFAQQGIRWKVADAQAAGLHPLAALGAQTSSFSNVVGGGIEYPKSSFGEMGQDLGRAIKAGQTSSERTSDLQSAVGKLATSFQLEKANLENELLRTNIAKERAQLPPPFPSPIPLPRPGPDRTVSVGQAVSEENLKQKAEDYPGTKIVRPFGYPLQANPWFNDGQQFEDRYGDSEAGSTLKFLVNTLADHVYTGYGLLPARPSPHSHDRRPASERRWQRRY